MQVLASPASQSHRSHGSLPPFRYHCVQQHVALTSAFPALIDFLLFFLWERSTSHPALAFLHPSASAREAPPASFEVCNGLLLSRAGRAWVTALGTRMGCETHRGKDTPSQPNAPWNRRPQKQSDLILVHTFICQGSENKL